MPSITVTQTQVDGKNNADMNPALAAKRYDGSSYTTGLITGRFSVNNEVLTQGRLFKADNEEFSSAAPLAEYKGGVTGSANVTLDNANTGVQVGDIILLGCYNYYGGSGGSAVGTTSGFTSIVAGAYSSYFAYRWSYRIATSSDTSGSRYVSTGNNINTMAVFKIDGTGTPVKQNHSATHYQSQVAGPISISNSNNGAVLVYGMSLGAYTDTTTTFSDDAGTRRLVADLNGVWDQDILSASAPTIIGYRGVAAGQSISNQSAELPNVSFKSQLIVHFTRT